MLLYIVEKNLYLLIKPINMVEKLDVVVDNTARESSDDILGIVDRPVRIWKSCCFRIDRECAMYIVQTIVGTSLIIFACVELAVGTNPEKSAPFWGLIGTMCGFIFIKMKEK